jgi:tRNA U38,U39,U40 pseudouridine synthase TruA
MSIGLSFLHNQVRSIVGSLKLVGRGATARLKRPSSA